MGRKREFGLLHLVRRRPSSEPVLPDANATIAYFGQDCTDYAVIRRISAFQSAGLKVVGLTFRRHKYNRDFVPTWENVALGETRDRHYLGRLLKLARACWIIIRHRRRIADASMLYARNIDMAVLALLAKLVSFSRAPLVYEVLDVQPAFVGPKLAARILRLAERVVLKRARLLVVSSPGFIWHYFRPVQKYFGRWFLMENKILGPQLRGGSPTVRKAEARLAEYRGKRWIIGWFGTLRCERSLEILSEVADRCPDKVVVYLRGYPTEHGIDALMKVVDPRPNMIYDGEFFSPRDLPDMYGAIDFGWCFDFLDHGANSDWLLPNRYYDCGYFDVPALTASGTWTGGRIAAMNMGWTFRAPFAEDLVRFIETVTPEEVAAVRETMSRLPRSLFCEEDETLRMVRLVREVSRSPSDRGSRKRGALRQLANGMMMGAMTGLI